MVSRDQKKSLVLMKELQRRSRKCHEFVRKSLLSEKIGNRTLSDALEHYFSYWNDFSHPGLFSVACQATGQNPDSMLNPQAALAMIAAAFDIQDDIIDRSPAKHGCPTVYGKFGEDMALLLGNAFLIDGFALLGSVVSKLPIGRARKVFEVIKNCLFEVGNAHALEMKLKGRRDVPPKEYLHILEMKSASIEADMHIAALFGTDNRMLTEALRKYGRTLGILATLREEFIDVFEQEELNRRVQSEALPIPIMYALHDAQSRVRIRELLDKEKLALRDSQELVDIVFGSKPLDELKNHMDALLIKTMNLVTKIEDQRAKSLARALSLLEDLAHSMLEDL
jgi:geranylgeranyl diphosphate synthase type II